MTPAEYGQPIGALAGVLPPSAAEAPEADVTEEMLILCGLSESSLNRFLPSFRKHGVPPVALKAVLTPTNAAWTVPVLFRELQRERAAMNGL